MKFTVKIGQESFAIEAASHTEALLQLLVDTERRIDYISIIEVSEENGLTVSGNGMAWLNLLYQPHKSL